MSGKANYRTKQHEELLKYLETVPGRHMTAGEICTEMKALGSRIGMTTVYRQLEKLVDSGTVDKYIVDGDSPACFAYIRSPEERSGGDCYHCKCEKCGAVIHLHCDEFRGFRDHVLGEHDFLIDPKRTVFYGLCSRCRSEAG